MGLGKRIAAVVVPLGLVVGGVAYGVSRHDSNDDKTLGECTTKVRGLSVILTDEQARNASLISAVAIRRGMPAHAATIALATALQESKLYNLRGGDRDSLGLFQQRPSQGWGTRQQVLDPVHATNAFYEALAQVPGYAAMPVTEAAQRVQRSGFPTAYAVYERDARALASALTGYSPGAFWCHVRSPESPAAPSVRRAAALREALLPAFGPVGVTVGSDGRLQVPASSSAPRGWAEASYLVAHAQELGISTVAYRGRAWDSGNNAGWHREESARDAAVLVR
ncbi:MAG TPA: hypothetical protein VGK78_10515 [Nocardioides sp.]|uniref:hypothetical protein n=1 Tax=Nocardioides sp. TaxID=35761 RepID=UPI002F3F954E